MNGAIAWFARNHVAANLLMALLVCGGLFTLPELEQRVFPEISLDIVSIDIAYPGASPREVEEAICVRVEEALQGLQGLRRVRSVAREGLGHVSVELLLGEDLRERMDQIRSQVESIRGLPEAAESAVVSQADIRFQVIDLALAGDVDEWTLRRMAEDLRDELTGLPEITEVSLVGTRPYEMAIEVSESDLIRHGLTFDDVSAAVQRSSLDLPGGALKTHAGEILLRTQGQAQHAVDFEALPLISRNDGTQLRVGDVARVVDGFEESERLSLFDGKPAALLRVHRVGHQSALDISKAARAFAKHANAGLPEGVELIPWQDQSRLLRERVDTVMRNARGGFLLVVCVLALFLHLRLALWVSLGIPLSFLGAIWLLPSFGVGIDMISLMAFIIVLGIVVDDAIIVGESVYTDQCAEKQAGRESARATTLAASVRGAQRVAVPVIFGVLTTIVAFGPLLNVPGPIGNVTRVIPIVVIACLCFSLVESLLVLPSHLAHMRERRAGAARSRISVAWHGFQDGIARGLERFIERTYRPTLERVLEWRGLAAATAIALFAISVSLLAGGWVRFTFQPNVEGDTMVAFLTLPPGSPASGTRAGVDQLARAAEAVRAEVAAEGGNSRVFAHLQTTVGEQPYRKFQASGPAAFMAAGGSGAHLGEVTIQVAAPSEREISVTELTRRWREHTGDIAGASELGFSSSIMSPGAAIHLELTGRDLDELDRAAAGFAESLAAYPGVIDVRKSMSNGKPELRIAMRDGAESLGVSLADLARQVRQAFYGHEVQRVQRGRDDVRVVVRYPESERRSLGDLEQMRVRGAGGAALPFASVAHAELAQGYASIERVDRRRVISVTADVDRSRANANEVVTDLQAGTIPDLLAANPGVRVSFAGEQREQSEILTHLATGWAIAMLAIYGLLAVPLRSYLQPWIIMSAIPFGLVGALAGHILLGFDFSMFSVIGVVALSGVVVNDSLVLVDCANQLREQGRNVHDAVIEAGCRRFRAILLTSLTTFAGLLPLLLETSPQARLLIPMAISLGFGVLFATAITLLLVPVVTLLLADLSRKFSRESERSPGTAGIRPATAR